MSLHHRPSRRLRLIASALALSCTLGALPLQAHAQMVPTDALVAASPSAPAEARARVNAFLAREQVRQALQQQGVDTEQALARVAAMSDEEVAQLDGRIAQAPAGGDVLGLLFTVFVILLVTDILGFTKVFPFTRSIR